MRKRKTGQPESTPEAGTELRQQAEQVYASRSARDRSLTASDKDLLLYELEVHRIELEMQNEELRRAQQEAQESRQRYLDLFDFAPVGYFVLDDHFLILEANLTGSRMLGLERHRLIGQRFLRFLVPAFQNDFYRFMAAAPTIDEQTLEPQIQKTSGEVFYAELRIVALKTAGENSLYRVAMMDITQRKQAEETLARAKDELEIKVKERTDQLQESCDEIMESQKALREANEQLKQYASKITQVQEEERKRIAYELHDDTAQYLSILKMQLGALVNSEEIQSPRVKERLQFLEKDADRAFSDVRRYSHELRPTILEHHGLGAALEQIADDFNKLGQLVVEVNVEGMEPELSEEIKLGFFRIAQESLNNARKHAKASRVDIDLHFNHKQLKMTVSDNGEGFDAKETLKTRGGKGSLGLLSMKERAELIHADLKIESEPGDGTKVILKAKI